MNDYVHCLSYGNGELLVLLPSNWLTSKSYQSIAIRLAERYRVVVPDLFRGNSRYTKNATTINHYVSALHKFLENLNVRKFYLMGFSFSGMVAVDYAKQYPEDIKGMILVNSIKYPLFLKKRNFTPINGYIKLFYHNSFSLKGMKINLLWFIEGINYFFNHTKQFFLDALIAIKYSKDIILKPQFPVKILVASNDEYMNYKTPQKRKNIDIEVVNGNHAWYFLNEDLLIEKIFNFLK